MAGMCSSGSSQPGSRAMCMPMVKVPLGLPLTVATSASLMSSLTSGPERIGAAAGVAASPQISTSHNARTVRTANIPLRMVLLLSGLLPLHHSRNGNSKEKGAPTPLPHHEEDCPNAPSAPIPGAMRQPIRIASALDPISCASRAGQSHQYYTVHEALYRVKLPTFLGYGSPSHLPVPAYPTSCMLS